MLELNYNRAGKNLDLQLMLEQEPEQGAEKSENEAIIAEESEPCIIEVSSEEVVLVLTKWKSMLESEKIVNTEISNLDNKIKAVLLDIEHSSEQVVSDYDFVSKLRELTKEKRYYTDYLNIISVVRNNLRSICNLKHINKTLEALNTNNKIL